MPIRDLSLRALFRSILFATLIGTICVCVVGLSIASKNQKLTEDLLKREITGRVSSQIESWIASLALNQKEFVLNDIRAHLPEMYISDLELIDSDKISVKSQNVASNVVILPKDADKSIPYYMRFQMVRKQQLPGQNYIIFLVFALGFVFLISALFTSLIFLKRFSRAISVLNESIDSPLVQEPKVLPDGLGEFGILVDKAFQLRDRARDAEKSRALAQLSRAVAHDIRSPLSVLVALSFKLKESLPEEAGLIDAVSSRISEIANDLLDSSRHQVVETQVSKVVQISKSLVNTVCELNEICLACKEAVGEKKIQLGQNTKVGISFYNEMSDDLKVSCDLKELRRTLSNLLNNSIEAIASTGFVSVTLSSDSIYALIEIRDSGAGMTQDLIEKVMRGPASEGKAKGNGLGLNPAIRLVGSWGGKLTIRSNVGQGTTIGISLRNV